jgi:hypothetical protein
MLMTGELTVTQPERIALKLNIPGIATGYPVGAPVFSTMLSLLFTYALERENLFIPIPPSTEGGASLDPRRCWFNAFGSEAFGIVGVTQLKAGLGTVRAELETLGLLPYAEIAWYDRREQVWRYSYPEGTTARMESNNDMLARWVLIALEFVEHRLKGR